MHLTNGKKLWYGWNVELVKNGAEEATSASHWTSLDLAGGKDCFQANSYLEILKFSFRRLKIIFEMQFLYDLIWWNFLYQIFPFSKFLFITLMSQTDETDEFNAREILRSQRPPQEVSPGRGLCSKHW